MDKSLAISKWIWVRRCREEQEEDIKMVTSNSMISRESEGKIQFLHLRISPSFINSSDFINLIWVFIFISLWSAQNVDWGLAIFFSHFCLCRALTCNFIHSDYDQEAQVSSEEYIHKLITTKYDDEVNWHSKVWLLAAYTHARVDLHFFMSISRSKHSIYTKKVGWWWLHTRAEWVKCTITTNRLSHNRWGAIWIS